MVDQKAITQQINHLNNSGANYVVLLGTPKHSNIGDRAIAYAEDLFITKHIRAHIVEIPFGVDVSVLQHIKKEATVILHGGGNFGDVWEEEESYRQLAIQALPENKMVLFPQTAFFKNRKALEQAVSVYGNHNNLTLILRETTSYKFVKKHFSNNAILAPDIVMSLPRYKPRIKRMGLLLVLRDDREKTISLTGAKIIDKFASEHFGDAVESSDMHIPYDDDKSLNEEHGIITLTKLDQFSRAKLVITDRLHGMIFALISGTPCIVFGSLTYKTTGVYEWIEGTVFSKYIKLCNNIEELESVYSELDINRKYRYRPSVYRKEWKKIIELIRSA